MHDIRIVIVTPALAAANNGNWQTARRWAAMLGTAYPVRLLTEWSGRHRADADDGLMIALHARRSASSVAAWRVQRAQAPLVLVLTGTDLYRDITTNAAAQASLRAADRLVVLNRLGAHSVPQDCRAKVRTVLQSCAARQPLAKTARHLRALMVGHLREEKSPRTGFDAMRRLAGRRDIRLDHIGAALDPALAAHAEALMRDCLQYRWLGALPHGAARRRIQQAHVLVHPSRMEGGAHVVIEAIRSGTPVLASRIDGNVGLLGEQYGGYFPVGDDAALAALLQRLRDEPAMLAALRQQCDALAPRFDPSQESATVHALVAELLRAGLQKTPAPVPSSLEPAR